MFFVEEEGASGRLFGVREVIEAQGRFSALYTDRGSHYWTTPEAGWIRSTLPSIRESLETARNREAIAVYSPEARGRSERPQQFSF